MFVFQVPDHIRSGKLFTLSLDDIINNNKALAAYIGELSGSSG